MRYNMASITEKAQKGLNAYYAYCSGEIGKKEYGDILCAMKNKDYWSIGDDNLCEAMVGLLL
jgi:hypothetical protein